MEKVVNLDGKEVVEAFFPMSGAAGSPEARWDETTGLIVERLDRGIDAAFITIGDPAFYSTFFYLYDRLLASMPACASRLFRASHRSPPAHPRPGFPSA